MDGELDPPALQKHRVAHHRWRATLQSYVPVPHYYNYWQLFTGGFFNTENQEALAPSILTTGYYTH